MVTVYSGDTVQNGGTVQSEDTMSQSGDIQNGDTILSGDTTQSGDIQNGDSILSGDTVQNGDKILSEWSHYTPIPFLHRPLQHYLPNERFLPLEFSGQQYFIPTERASYPARLIPFNLIASTIMNSTNYVTSVCFFIACSCFLPQVEIFIRAPFRRHPQPTVFSQCEIPDKMKS